VTKAHPILLVEDNPDDEALTVQPAPAHLADKVAVHDRR
jgi:hypothetical protein